MLYIMRHGKTDWNAMYKLQGRTDIPLNEEGREMARKAGEIHKDLHLDVCYCSPLCRAKETAEIFLEGRDVPLYTDDRLKEISFGMHEGVDHVYEKKDHPVYAFFFDPERYVPGEGGETYEELFSRTGEFLQEIVYPAIKEGKDVLIIGHGAMNNSIVCQVHDIPLARFWDMQINNCELYTLNVRAEAL